MAERTESNVLDLRFWLEQMGDYARFIIIGLPRRGDGLLERGQQFKTLFDTLYGRAKGSLDVEELRALNREANQATQDFRRYILEIVRQIITQKTDIIANLYPEILNHMVGDTELFLTTLAAYAQDISARVNSTQLGMDLLFGLYSSCKYIADSLSLAFFRERAKAEAFMSQFLNLYQKAYVLNGFRRAGLDEFPSLVQANDEMQEIMQEYARFIMDLIRLKNQKKIIGPISTLFLDNTYRQLCYYMMQLSAVSTVNPPLCDPASPRKE